MVIEENISFEFVHHLPEEDLVALYQAGGWWNEEPGERERLPALVRGSFIFLIARTKDGRIVGMGRVLSDGASDAYIQDLAVLPDYRHQGIGRELVKRLVARCQEAGLPWIALVAEPNTEAFYASLGFSPLAGHVPMRLEKRG